MRSSSSDSPIDTSLVKTAYSTDYEEQRKQTTAPFTKTTLTQNKREYLKKTYHKSTNPFIATCEAVGAHLLRTVFSLNFAPKNRVLELDSFVDDNEGCRTVYTTHLISKKIQFTPIYSFDEGETDAKKAAIAARERLSDMLLTPGAKRDNALRSLAKLSLSILCFEETDLHTGNWGVDHHDNIIKIDHDRMFSTLSDSLVNGVIILGGKGIIHNAEHLNTWPNLIYTAEHAFGIISEDDINNPISFTDTKPVNDPFVFFRRKLSPEQFNALAQDPVFIQWRFFYLTKYLLLLTPERVQNIISDHSITNQSNSTENQKALFDCVMQRREKIKQTIVRMKDYQYFLETLSSEMMHALESEMNESNAEFSDQTGTPKKHKKHHTIDINEVKISLAALKREVDDSISTDSTEKQKEREYNLEIKRALRELTAISYLEKNMDYRSELLNIASPPLSNFTRVAPEHQAEILEKFPFINAKWERKKAEHVAYVSKMEWDQTEKERVMLVKRNHFFRSLLSDAKEEKLMLSQRKQKTSTLAEKPIIRLLSLNESPLVQFFKQEAPHLTQSEKAEQILAILRKNVPANVFSMNELLSALRAELAAEKAKKSTVYSAAFFNSPQSGSTETKLPPRPEKAKSTGFCCCL